MTPSSWTNGNVASRCIVSTLIQVTIYKLMKFLSCSCCRSIRIWAYYLRILAFALVEDPFQCWQLVWDCKRISCRNWGWASLDW
jgi:hypothetical protein